MSGSLYDLYVSMTPEGQRVPAFQGAPNLEDAIRQQRPDVWQAYQAQTAGTSRLDPRLPRFMANATPEQQQAWLANQPSRAPSRTAGLTLPRFMQNATPAQQRAWLEEQARIQGLPLSAIPSITGPSTTAATNLPPVSTGAWERNLPTPGTGGDIDWASIIAALEGQRPGGGGVGVDRSLFRLSETPEEAAMLQRELADIEARRLAGDTALRAGWGNVQSANAAAAEKARSMVAERGESAAGVWSTAAQQARDLAAARGAAAGEFEGRAAIDVSPDAGVADWAGFMESQAPAERRLAERQQEMLGSDLDWMAGLAGAQSEAYAADLRRQASVMSFERASDHNRRVQDRIAQERMVLAQMQQQAQATNASLAAQRDAFDPFSQLNNMIGSAAVMNSPGLLAQQLGITEQQAAGLIRNFLAGTTQVVAAGNP